MEENYSEDAYMSIDKGISDLFELQRKYEFEHNLKSTSKRIFY